MWVVGNAGRSGHCTSQGRPSAGLKNVHERACRAQATFLRGSSTGGDAEGEVAEELNRLPDDELDTRCRRNGLSRRWPSI